MLKGITRNKARVPTVDILSLDFTVSHGHAVT